MKARHGLFSVLFFLLGLPWVLSASKELQLEPVKLDAKDPVFAPCYPTYSRITTNSFPIPPEAEYKRSPHGTKTFIVINLTGPRTPCEDVRAAIVVLQNGEQKCCLRVAGFKNISVDWVTEEVLKVVNWPGPGHSTELTELIKVETGDVVFKSATGHYPPFPQNPKPR